MERERAEATEQIAETEGSGEKRPRTDTDTDPECTQSKLKKGQMMSIFLSDSDEEDIMDFVVQHKVLYDKTHTSSGKRALGNSSYKEFICKHCQELV